MKSCFVAKASAALILLCALSATWESTAADAPNPDVDFATAMEQYRLGKRADAYGKFSRLADRNHADAARIALLMVRFGPSLFGGDWGASQPQIERWRQLAITPVVIASLVPIPVRASDSFEEGIAAYRDTKYQKAVVIFRQAAERGDARAQEILGFMHLHGSSMYGAAVPQDRNQAIHWFGRAATGGREVAQHMLCVLNGRPGSTVVDRANCVANTPTASMKYQP